MYIIFHCIIVEHIPECLIWWDSVSYVSYYLTLGYTPILEFIICFAVFFSLLDLFLDLCGSSHWGIPPSFSSWGLLRAFSLLDLFLDLYGSSYWGIPPSLSLSDLLQAFSLLDLFLDLCESSYWGIPLLALFYWGHSPLFGFSTFHADFTVIRPIWRSLRVIT